MKTRWLIQNVLGGEGGLSYTDIIQECYRDLISIMTNAASNFPSYKTRVHKIILMNCEVSKQQKDMQRMLEVRCVVILLRVFLSNIVIFTGLS